MRPAAAVLVVALAAGLIAADQLWWGGEGIVYLGRALTRATDWMAFWR